MGNRYGVSVWDVVSGVPGLGHHIPTSTLDTIYREWADSSDCDSDSQAVALSHDACPRKHRKLERAGMSERHVKKPRVRFAGVSGSLPPRESQHSLPPKENKYSLLPKEGQHQKLSRVENACKQHPIDCRKLIKIDSQLPRKHFCTMSGKSCMCKCDYSYAYSNLVSPSALIKQDDCDKYSDVGSTDSNIYEVIDHNNSKEEYDNSEEDSLYLNISRKRRDHLKLHRFVDWDFQVELDENYGGHSRLMKLLTQNSAHAGTRCGGVAHKVSKADLAFQEPSQLEIHEKGMRYSSEKNQKMNIKKSLSKTLSTIVISIRNLF